MGVVEFIKQKGQWMNIAQNTLKTKFESQIKVISVSIEELNEKKAEWLQLIDIFPWESQQEQAPNYVNPELDALFERKNKDIGKEVHVGDWHRINQAGINQFADVTGDNQWIHVDEARAQEESPFGSTVAHGYYILSLLPLLTGTVHGVALESPSIRLVVNTGMNNVKFLTAVKPDTCVRARTSLLNVTKKRKHLDVVKQVKIEIENKATPALIADISYRIYCR